MLVIENGQMTEIEVDGEKLKQLRGDRSLMDISELAEKQFSDVALMKWEKGERKPKLANIETLLRIFDCKLEDILKPSEMAISK